MDHHTVIDIFVDNLSFFFLAIDTKGTTFLIILLGSLLTLSFIISASEVALFSLGNKDINMLKTKQHPYAKRMVSLLDESKEVYTSLLVSGTITNICIIFLSNYLINRFMPYGSIKGVHILNLSLDFWLELFIRVFVIGFLLIFFCKVLPKVYATQNNLRVGKDFSYIVEGIHLLFRRISVKMVYIADTIGKRLGANRSRSTDIPAADRTRIAQLVSARTGLPQAQAQQRVDAAITQAKVAADEARKAAAKLAFWFAAALLAGALSAGIAAVEGGQLRDDVDEIGRRPLR